jgi:hypothetical protein
MEKVLSILVAANLFAACGAADQPGKTELAATGLPPAGLVVQVTYDPIEDFGRSVELYVCDPEKLKEQSPARYDWIKNNVFEGKEFPKK